MSKREKIIIYDALVGSKLLYGLDTLPLTTASLNKLNPFHLKGLRRILRLPTTFVDRTMTNRKVLEIAEAESNKNTANRHARYEPRTKRDQKQIKLVSEVLNDRSKKMLGDILREGPRDLRRQVTFNDDTPFPNMPHENGRASKSTLDFNEPEKGMGRTWNQCEVYGTRGTRVRSQEI